MFEHIFKTELAFLTTDTLLIDKLFAEIKKNYSRPVRKYHTLAHLDTLISELLPLKNDINDWQALVLSIAYHDIVYNVLKSDNEEKSAKLAYDRLSQLSIPAPQKQKCVEQILATKKHEASPDSDTNFFIDADLAILGANNEVYKNYAAQIRKEYSIYPDLVYMPGRKKVLQHFLTMPFVYKTTHFRNKYEAQAKQNLAAEMKALK